MFRTGTFSICVFTANPRKLTMNTVKRPPVLAAAMPLVPASARERALSKGDGIWYFNDFMFW